MAPDQAEYSIHCAVTFHGGSLTVTVKQIATFQNVTMQYAFSVFGSQHFTGPIAVKTLRLQKKNGVAQSTSI
jgi:hypothetical protein